MTLMGLFAAGLLAGLGAGLTAFAVWAETHHYRRIRLEAIRVDVLCHQCDHLERHNRRLTDEHAELREGVGDLLDTVAHQRHVIDQLTPTPSPVPVYGIHTNGAHTP